MKDSVLKNFEFFLSHVEIVNIVSVFIIFIFLLFLNKEFYKGKVFKYRRYANNKEALTYLYIVANITLLSFITNFIYILGVVSFAVFYNNKNLIQNVVAGILIKSNLIKTAIKIGSNIKLKEDDVFYKILKINLTKSYLLNTETEEIASIQNITLIEEKFEHKPFEEINNLEFSIFLKNTSLRENIKNIEDILKEIVKKDYIDFEYLRESLDKIKYEYGFFPNYKPRYIIDITDQENDNVLVYIKVFTYSKISKNELFLKIKDVANGGS